MQQKDTSMQVINQMNYTVLNIKLNSFVYKMEE